MWGRTYSDNSEVVDGVMRCWLTTNCFIPTRLQGMPAWSTKTYLLYGVGQSPTLQL